VCNKAAVLECRLQLPPDEAHVDAHLKELYAAIQVLQHDIDHSHGFFDVVFFFILLTGFDLFILVASLTPDITIHCLPSLFASILIDIHIHFR
jgi:hypothetical protein